jgi:phosphohistidine swiveling domain-containing protein
MIELGPAATEALVKIGGTTPASAHISIIADAGVTPTQDVLDINAAVVGIEIGIPTTVGVVIHFLI